jgi:hypothetical protein
VSSAPFPHNFTHVVNCRGCVLQLNPISSLHFDEQPSIKLNKVNNIPLSRTLLSSQFSKGSSWKPLGHWALIH